MVEQLTLNQWDRGLILRRPTIIFLPVREPYIAEFPKLF